jgi:peptide/nickel transport system ATP-binding protein/oligopeptide transport system ATP-binding protein
VINLLTRLQGELGVAYLFITHDLAVVRHIAEQVAVMYLGRIVEMGSVDEVYANPAHPYTVALLSAALNPRAGRRSRIVLSGEIPSLDRPPAGCSFHTRCWLRNRLGNPEICDRVEPVLQSATRGWAVACHFAEETPRHAPTRATEAAGGAA